MMLIPTSFWAISTSSRCLPANFYALPTNRVDSYNFGCGIYNFWIHIYKSIGDIYKFLRNTNNLSFTTDKSLRHINTFPNIFPNELLQSLLEQHSDIFFNHSSPMCKRCLQLQGIFDNDIDNQPFYSILRI